ncbi:PepSY domain-containing protein [Arenimonas sp.]|uniref:PepSY domain-containing protein n=1 Tax=Arenimonas sp. TaxID=1872635 RepID=UPI0039E4FA45
MFLRLLALSLLAFSLTFGSADAYAQNQRDRGQQSQNSQESQRERSGQSDLPNSVRRVEQQTGGEVLRAEPMQRDGHEVYRIKVLTSDGRVRVMQDDPQQRRGSSRQESPSRRSSPPRSEGNNNGGGRGNGNNNSDEGERPPF